jgi:NitT/TauT family transport system substrate-binding protein
MSECTGSLAAFPLGGYFATSAWAAKYPHTAHAFQVAMEKAQAYANAHPAAVRAVLPAYTKIPWRPHRTSTSAFSPRR